MHKIIITNAEKIYYNPELILRKKEIVVSLISETIEETIRNQIPIDKILTEYLSGVFDEDEQEPKNEIITDNKLQSEGNEIESNELEEESDEDFDEDFEEDLEEDDNEPDKVYFQLDHCLLVN